jgi:hypothetical protein
MVKLSLHKQMDTSWYFPGRKRGEEFKEILIIEVIK